MFYLCLEQKEQNLEDLTKDFLDLACLTAYPDHSLCVFYFTSLGERFKVRLLSVGLWGDFDNYVVNNGSPLIICPARKDITRPSPDPRPSQPPLTHCIERMPEPISGTGPEPAAMSNRTKTELDPNELSDQVRESSVTVGVLVEFEGM